MNCYNCALPEGTLPKPGTNVKLTLAPENNFKRERKVTVWCCTEECAVQAAYLAEYGNSHKAPITLSQFRSQWRRKNGTSKN